MSKLCLLIFHQRSVVSNLTCYSKSFYLTLGKALPWLRGSLTSCLRTQNAREWLSVWICLHIYWFSPGCVLSPLLFMYTDENRNCDKDTCFVHFLDYIAVKSFLGIRMPMDLLMSSYLLHHAYFSYTSLSCQHSAWNTPGISQTVTATASVLKFFLPPNERTPRAYSPQWEVFKFAVRQRRRIFVTAEVFRLFVFVFW